MSETGKGFARRLRRELERRKWTQTALATKTGIERSELNRLVNGKRDPRGQEIGWLSAAFDMEPEELLEEVDVMELETFTAEVEHARKIASRTLTAEQERDEATASLTAAEESLREAEKGWRTERAELQAMLAQQREDCAERLQRRDEELAQREGQLLGRLGEARDQTIELERQLRRTRRVADDRQRQIAQLQRALEAEKAKVSSAGLFGGLIGAALAGGTAAVLASNGGEDYDDDEDDD